MVTHTGYAYRPDGYLVATVDESGDRRHLALDPTGRITRVTAQDWLERYAYSPTGDVVEAHWPDGQAPNPARGEREYSGTLIRRAGRVRYEHDAQGRVILRQRAHHSRRPDTWRYTWDSHDRLTAVQTPDGTTWTYRYDPLGRRIGKYRHDARGRVTERLTLAWDGPHLIETLHRRPDGSAEATTWDYRPGTSTPIAQTNRSWLATAPQAEIDHRFHTIVTDLVGAPTHLVGPDGDTTWHAHPTIWGTTVAASAGAIDCPLRFPGQYHDPETGHHYNNQRYYDPETARYLSKDPLGLTAAPNSVLYAINPTDSIDTLGLACLSGNRTLDWTRATINDGGINAVERHLMRFAEGGSLESLEQGMLDRLRAISTGELDASDYDLRFYTHELRESVLYRNAGYPTGQPEVDSYELWDQLHTQALKDYGLTRAGAPNDLYHPNTR